MRQRIWIDDIEIELGRKPISIPITYQLLDIKNLSSRKGSMTKTVTIPRTALNDKVCGVAYDVNAANQFNKFTTHNIRIEEGSETVFLGLMRLTKVTIGEISFFCYADLSKLKDIFGEDTLNQLQLADLDHLYDSTIFDTWSGSYPSDVPPDYFYPIIDYGQFRGLTPLNDPEQPPDVLTSDIYPGVYLYRLIRQMLLDKGYTLKTSFFEDPQIAKILMPFSNERFIHTDTYLINTYGFEGYNLATLPYNVPPSIAKYTVPVTNEVSDPLNQWDGNEYTASATQRSTVKFNGYLDTTGTYVAGYVFNFLIEKWDDVLMVWETVLEKPYKSIDGNAIGINVSVDVFLQPNDKIRISIDRLQAGVALSKLILVYVQNFKIIPKQDAALDILPGEMVQIAPNLPPMKQAELFKACYQMFDWVVNVDDVKGVVYIEVDEIFYLNGGQMDMSEKINLAISPSIEYQALDFKRKYDFKYLHDDEDFQLLIFDGYPGDVKFGDGRLYLEERGEAELIGEVPVSPTIVAGSFLGGGNHIDMPTMLLNSDPDNKHTQHMPRLLINGGLVDISTLSDGIYSELYIEGVGSVTQLPLCYFQKKKYQDDIDGKDFNLSFQTPNIVDLSTGNLIDKFYRASITMLSNSPQVVAYFNLTSKDVSNLNYATLWYIDYFSATFRLNKILDYLPGRPSSTKVELVKVGVPAPVATYEPYE